MRYSFSLQIWSALHANQLTRAASLFLLARHIYTSLTFDTKTSSAEKFSSILNKQWTAISHFRATILEVATQLSLTNILHTHPHDLASLVRRCVASK